MLWLVSGCAQPEVRPQTSGTSGGNLIKNASFEERNGDLPSEWVLDEWRAKKGKAAVVPTNAHSGRFALKLMPNQRNTLEFPFALGQGFPAEGLRGKKLYISAWLAAEGGARAVAGLSAGRADSSVAAQFRLTSSEPELALKEGVFNVPADAETLFVVQHCAVEGTQGVAYFDDVTVRVEGPGMPVRAPDGGPLRADISVDGTKIVRAIPRSLYGTNVEWVFDGYGLWDRRAKRLRPELVQLTRELNLSLIRFPGGLFSDFYHWRDGIGPLKSRRITQHAPGDPSSLHLFGTDEALDFADQTGAQLLMTVNAGTGSAEEAADWVRYVNRSGEGARVRYWEVGNELYINDDSPVSKASALAPAAYAERFLRFAAAMRAADPSIKIGAISDESYWARPPDRDPNWTEEVLRKAGSQIDFLAVHNAYAPAVWADTGADLRAVYAAMLAAPVLIKQNLGHLSKLIETVAPKRSAQIKLAITEWGPFFHSDPSSRFVDHVKTLGSALFVASAMKAFLESPRAEIATFFKLVDNSFMGWIGLRGGNYIPKAPYLALQMYTSHFGSELLASRTTSPTYDSAAAGLVPAVGNVPYLDVVASRSQDGNTLYLMGINKHFDLPITATIRLSGFRPRANGRAWILQGTGLDANTGTELPMRDAISWAVQATDQSNPRFAAGKPGKLGIASSPFVSFAKTFDYTFPPHSITSLEIKRLP